MKIIGLFLLFVSLVSAQSYPPAVRQALLEARTKLVRSSTAPSPVTPGAGGRLEQITTVAPTVTLDGNGNLKTVVTRISPTTYLSLNYERTAVGTIVIAAENQTELLRILTMVGTSKPGKWGSGHNVVVNISYASRQTQYALNYRVEFDGTKIVGLKKCIDVEAPQHVTVQDAQYPNGFAKPGVSLRSFDGRMNFTTGQWTANLPPDMRPQTRFREELEKMNIFAAVLSDDVQAHRMAAVAVQDSAPPEVLLDMTIHQAANDAIAWCISGAVNVLSGAAVNLIYKVPVPGTPAYIAAMAAAGCAASALGAILQDTYTAVLEMREAGGGANPVVVPMGVNIGTGEPPIAPPPPEVKTGPTDK